MASILRNKSVKKGQGHKAPKDGSALRDCDTLVDRNLQIKHVTKSLLHYYKGLSAIESTTAKETSALTATIQVPFHEGHHFLGEGGWQEVLYEVRDKTKVLAEHHSTLAATLERTVVKELEGVRSEIKAHVAAIEKECSALFDEVDKERSVSAQHLTTLQQGIDTYENSSDHMLPQHDPVITHVQVHKQLTKQVHKENDAQAALIRFQQQQPTFEASMFKNIQSACKLYDEAKAAKSKDIEQTQSEIAAALQRVAPETEYNYFSKQEGAVLDPNTPTRSVQAINFPGLNHDSTKPLKEGYLERKKRFTKTYKEAYYILSPSGFLHERKSNDDTNALKPTFSLFVPECSLGPAAKPTDKSHKFHVEGNKAVKSSFEGKMKSSFRFGGKEIAYSFRARTHNEMLGWWEQMDKLSRDTKTAPVTGPRRTEVNPIAAAVANVGYEQPKVHPTEAVEDVPIAEGGVAPALSEGTAGNVTAAGVPVQDPEVVAERKEEAQLEEEEEEEEEGGSSAEEEEEEERLARTAPTTPAAGLHATSDPLHVDAEKAHEPAETLPTYTGDGTTVAEQEAAQGEKKKGGLFSSIFGGSPTPVVPDNHNASTSNAHPSSSSATTSA